MSARRKRFRLRKKAVGPREKLGELLESQEKTFWAQEKSWEKSLSARRNTK